MKSQQAPDLLAEFLAARLCQERKDMAVEREITLTLKIQDRYHTTHERELSRAEFETDASFFARAQKLLEKMREELP